MNRLFTSAFIAASAAIAAPVFADDITPAEPFVSTATRAQVLAELEQSRTGRNPWSIAFDPLAGFRSSLSRDEVRAEYIESRDEVASRVAEDSGSFAQAEAERSNGPFAAARDTLPQVR